MKIKILGLSLLFLLLISSCKKLDSLNESSSTKNSHSASRIGSSGTDSTDYYLNMDKPTRDVILFKKSGGVLPATKAVRIGDRVPTREEQQQIATVINPTYPNYHCCNGICLTIPEDPYGFYLPFTDIWGNPISYIGRYGTDPRQMYYVYTPSNANVNSKIVVLIHGGAWITGPDPDQVNGWGAAFAPDALNSTTNKQANNLVKNLLLQGYVVVVPLYRLVAYGDNNSDIMATPVKVEDQVDDINAAIIHIKTNFPTCLWNRPLNANNIQVVGESAGANLALLFSYTKAITSYIKSVISVAGPTNMNQFANFVKSKNLINQTYINQNCNSPFVWDNFNNTNRTHLPFYNIFDPPTDYNNMLITNVTNFNSMNCNITTLNNPYNVISPAPANPVTSTIRRGDTYKLVQSCVREYYIPNPLTFGGFTAISPRFQLNSLRNIPTFIIHGTADRIVPLSYCHDGMQIALDNNGGANVLYNNTFAPTTYPSGNGNKKHLIKLFWFADHNVSDFQHPGYSTNSGPAQTQTDVLNWLNGH